jgi:hypothetical protein
MQRTFRLRTAARLKPAGDVVVRRRDGQVYAVLPPRIATMLKGNRTVELAVEAGEIVVRWTDRRTRPKKLRRGK